MDGVGIIVICSCHFDILGDVYHGAILSYDCIRCTRAVGTDKYTVHGNGVLFS